MINMQSTFDLSSFKSINAPSLGAYSISSFLFPKGEKLFGETFYAIFDGKIYGLKILAWALGITFSQFLHQLAIAFLSVEYNLQ